jgi:DNA repair exonuclease SbcCD nuclease subunit
VSPAGAPRAATLLHTSDCHLHSDLSGAEHKAFAGMVDLAVRSGVDAVLVTGDLFDHNRVADRVLDWTGEELDRLGCPVVLIPGNHDGLDGTSVHHRFDAARRCRRVTFIDDHRGTTVEVPGTDVVVWARAMIEHEPGFRPLAGVPDRRDDRWCVAAGHGLVMESETPNGRSSPIFPSDLDAVDWDYIALGHCHAHREVRGGDRPAYYAGATYASRGQVPGAVLVDFVPGVGTRPRWTDFEPGR